MNTISKNLENKIRKQKQRKTENKIKLTKEKIAVSEMLIKKLEFDINDRNISTSEMLRQMIVKCQNLIISDF